MATISQILNPQICSCDLDIRKGVIRRFSFLKKASEKTLDQLFQSLRFQSFVEGEEIPSPVGNDGIFGIVARGAFKVFRHVENEHIIVFDLLTASDFFLYTMPDDMNVKLFTYPDQIMAMTTSCLLFMDKKKLEPILYQDPHLIPDFFASITERFSKLQERFVRFMFFPAEHRLAYLLLFLHSKGPKRRNHPNLIPFTITRKDLANMAGLTIETVSRILTSFEKDEIIRSGRGWIEILNFDALKSRSKHDEDL